MQSLCKAWLAALYPRKAAAIPSALRPSGPLPCTARTSTHQELLPRLLRARPRFTASTLSTARAEYVSPATRTRMPWCFDENRVTPQTKSWWQTACHKQSARVEVQSQHASTGTTLLDFGNILIHSCLSDIPAVWITRRTPIATRTWQHRQRHI